MTSDYEPNRTDGVCPRLSTDLADQVSELASGPDSAETFTAAAAHDLATYVGNLFDDEPNAVVAAWAAAQPAAAAALLGLFGAVAQGQLTLTIATTPTGPGMV